MSEAHWLDDGPRDPFAVVFLHAFPLHSGMWADTRRSLGDEVRCVAPDVRGSGRAPLGAFPASFESWVDDLSTLLERLEVRRALLVGCSMGGYLALRLAEREPSRVAGLFLANTQSSADGDEAKLKRAAGIRRLEREGVVPYTEAFFESALSPTTRAERPEVLQRCRELVATQSAAGLAAGLLGLATRTDTTSSLERIAVPTWVVGGEDDTITPPAVLSQLSSRIPGAELRILPGAGHLTNLEAPRSFERLLGEFVTRARTRG